ncbi:MAG: radical SAM protein [Desulfobacterales bacterium]
MGKARRGDQWGEPFAYRSNGYNLLDMIQGHPDLLFMSYTNGTLLNDRVAERLADLGNYSPAISVEGWRERTDIRRGEGVFDQVLDAFSRLREVGVPFGISLTATRENAKEILSEKFIDFLFEEQGAAYGWIFHYMPIGRSYTIDLMPTPEQRLWMWRRSWEIIREKQIFLADFWNHGTLSHGCISAGRYTGGGYMYIDWNGFVTPCVFVPYSPVNINDLYAEDKTLTDAWRESFFAEIRDWQEEYVNGDGEHGNWLVPCPIRDHNAQFRSWLRKHEPDPVDENAAQALLDPDYACGMDAYDEAYQALSSGVWKRYYLEKQDN